MKTLNTCAFMSMSSEGVWRESLTMMPCQPSDIVNLLAENRAEKQTKKSTSKINVFRTLFYEL